MLVKGAPWFLFYLHSLTPFGPWKRHYYDNIMPWKFFPRYWLFCRGIHRSPVDSTHKGPVTRVLIFSVTSAYTNGWMNHRVAGGLRHYNNCDVIVMIHRFLWGTITLTEPNSNGVSAILKMGHEWVFISLVYVEKNIYPNLKLGGALTQSC